MDDRAESLDFNAYQDAAHAAAEATMPVAMAVPYDPETFASFDWADDSVQPIALDFAICGIFFCAFLVGNALFDWFIPACNGAEMLMITGGALVALRLLFTQPLLALVLAFGLGDPLLDTYGHCVMGL